MAGRTSLATYERDDGTFGAVRVGPGTITAWNVVATGAKTGTLVKARGSKRQYGVIARSVSLSRQIGTVAAYSGGTVNITIPVFQKAIWANLAAGQTLAYKDVTDWTVSGTSAEERK